MNADTASNSNETPWITEPLVPEEIFTDRADSLDLFYKEALKSATRRGFSMVFLGRRRMGKTEIFKRVVNRLFFEQDSTSKHAVVPVYYTFGDKPQDRWDFSKQYLENFMRHYVAFYTRQPDIITKGLTDNDLLDAIEASRKLYPFTERLDWLLEWHAALLKGQMTTPEQQVVEIPRRISAVDDSTIVMFLDEFQNTRLPQYDFDIVGYMKEAVESLTCPHFVTGSAMSILAREIIGRGALFGRFDSATIKPLSDYWGATLALRAATYYKAELPELIAPVVATRCGGNPFYIVSLIRQAVRQGEVLNNEEAINNVLAVDLSSGFIWGELHAQVSSWIARINDYGITKWILYLSALEELEENDRISLTRIQHELKVRDGQDVSIDKIRDVLVRLSRGDLLQYMELGGWFRRIDDPILLEFLRIWGRIEVEGRHQGEVEDELVTRYNRLKRRVRETQGYLGEVYMIQVLYSSQDKRKLPLPGHFFNSHDDISMRWPLSYIRQRVRLGGGKGQEIDVLAAIGGETWICQSKWVTDRKIGVFVLEELMAQADAIWAERDPLAVRMWLFAHNGLTAEAEAVAEAEGILWSNREQLDGLLAYLDLRPLPELIESLAA